MNALQTDVMMGKLLSEAEQLWLAFERNQQSRETAKKLRAKLDEVVRLKNANKSHPYLPLLLHQWPNWEFWREQANARLSTPSDESLYELSTQRFANLPFAEALSELQNMFAANPGHPDLTQFALDKSDEFLHDGQPDFAAEVLRVAVHHVGSSPHFADLHRNLEFSEAWLRAQATLPVGDWQSARESMEVLSRAPEGVRLKVEREMAKHYDHAYDLGQVQAARKLYELELVLEPAARSRERELRDLEKQISNAEVIARLQATLETIPPETYDYEWLVKLSGVMANRPDGIVVRANPELPARLNGWLREACDRFLRAKGQGQRKEALEQVDEVMRLYEVTRQLEQATGAVPVSSVPEAPSQATLGLAAVNTAEQLRAWLDGHTLEQARSELVVETWNEELTQHKHEEELLQEQLQSEQKARATLEGQLQQKENQFTQRVNNLAADLTSLRHFVLPDSAPPAGKPQNLNQVVVDAIRCEVVDNLLPEMQKAAKSAIAEAVKNIKLAPPNVILDHAALAEGLAPKIEHATRTAVASAVRDIQVTVPRPSVTLDTGDVATLLAPQLEVVTRTAIEKALKKDVMASTEKAEETFGGDEVAPKPAPQAIKERGPVPGLRSWIWQLVAALGAICSILFLALWASGMPFPIAPSPATVTTPTAIGTPTVMATATPPATATSMPTPAATATDTPTATPATLTATPTSTLEPLTEILGASLRPRPTEVAFYTTPEEALKDSGPVSGTVMGYVDRLPQGFIVLGRSNDGTVYLIRSAEGTLRGWVRAEYIQLPGQVDPSRLLPIQ